MVCNNRDGFRLFESIFDDSTAIAILKRTGIMDAFSTRINTDRGNHIATDLPYAQTGRYMCRLYTPPKELKRKGWGNGCGIATAHVPKGCSLAHSICKYDCVPGDLEDEGGDMTLGIFFASIRRCISRKDERQVMLA